MPEPELKLNSLSRYSKQSPRLVLEEYSNCEVPAGCGGVVLRWRKPGEPIPMLLRSFTSGAKREFVAIDGENIGASPKIPVSYGMHALTLILHEVNPQFACLLLVAKLDQNYVRILKSQGDTTVRTLPDGTWRYRLEAPQDDLWKGPGFDDSGWHFMIEKPFGGLPRNYGDDIGMWTRDLVKEGAKGLGVEPERTFVNSVRATLGRETKLPAVYIRKTFEVLEGGKG